MSTTYQPIARHLDGELEAAASDPDAPLDRLDLDRILDSVGTQSDEFDSEPTSASDDDAQPDESLVEKALEDLRDDSYRTGKPCTQADVDRAVARHRLSVEEAALLTIQAQAEGLLPQDEELDADEQAWDERFEHRVNAQPRADDTDALRLFFRDVGAYPLLTAQDEVRLARAIERGKAAALELQKNGARAEAVEAVLERTVERGRRAQERMTLSNLRLVFSIARQYQGHGLDLLDLIQEGVIGLTRAVELFQWRLGFKFSTYATWWIRQAVQRGLANHGRTIRLPVHVGERIAKMRRVERKLSTRLDRAPTLDELDAELGWGNAQIQFLHDVMRQPLSLDQQIGEGPDASTVADFIEDTSLSVEDTVLEEMERKAIRGLIDVLPHRDRLIISQRYGFDGYRPTTLEEIGRQLGVTRERVRQLQVAAEKTLRALLELGLGVRGSETRT